MLCPASSGSKPSPGYRWTFRRWGWEPSVEDAAGLEQTAWSRWKGCRPSSWCNPGQDIVKGRPGPGTRCQVVSSENQDPPECLARPLDGGRGWGKDVRQAGALLQPMPRTNVRIKKWPSKSKHNLQISRNLFVANIHVHPPDILEPLAIRCQIIAVSCGVQSHLASGQWKEYGLNITFVRQERCNIISTRWSLLTPVLLKRVRSVPNPNVVPHQLLLLDLTKGVERHIKRDLEKDRFFVE